MATLLFKGTPRESLGSTLRRADTSARGLHTPRVGAVARNVGLVLSGQAGLSASRFAALLLLSHGLAPGRFAECAIYAASNLVVGNLCELGINISCLKFAAGAQGESWLRIVSRFLLLRLVLTAAVISGVLLLAPSVSVRLLKHPEFAMAIRLACGGAAVASIASFSQALLQSRLEFGRMARQNAAAAVLQILPVLGWHSLVALFAGDMLSRLWIVAANSRLLASALRKVRIHSADSPGWKPIATFANWITLSTLIGALYNYIPSIALSRWAAASALGAYSLGNSLGGGFALLINTTSTVLLPEAVAANTPARRRAYLTSYLPGSAVLSVALLALIWLPGPLASRIFPAALPDTVRVFQLLATAQVLLLPANPIQFLLYGAGRPQWRTASDGLITVLFAVAVIWFAPPYGAVGVACALLICQTTVKAVQSLGLACKGWGLG